MLPEARTKEFDDYLEEIGNSNKPKRHKNYELTVKAMHDMGVHMTGDNPKKLLDIKRPNEDDEAKKYRLKSYKPKTKASANKVVSVINRIYNERLYSIEYNESEKIDEQKDGLKTYMTKEMPYYVSLMNYIKSVFSKMHLKDANGVIGVLPADFETEDTELYKPIPIFYTAQEVVDFEDQEFYTIQLGGFTNKPNEEQTIIIFDKQQIRVFFREKRGDNFTVQLEFTHGFGIVPAFRVGGVVLDSSPPQLFESFIAGVLPHWDDAVTMFSDLQAAIVNHLYPEKWEYTVDCDAKGCQSGQRTVKDANDKDITIDCANCQGTGKKTTKSPYHVYQVNRDALNVDAPLPTPPFGYGEKELESTKFLDELADKEIQKGFEAINMDILNKVGENQSGISKVIDRQDLDGFLDVYSSHVFNYVLPNMIWFIMLWRYSLVMDEKALKEYFPKIKEPTTFDVYSISLLTEEFARLKESGVSGSFLSGIQKDIIEKRFANQEDVSFYTSIIDIDPLAHLTNDEMLTNSRVIGSLEMFIHTYAKDLVEEAIDTKDDFLSLPLMERKEIIRTLAESKQPKVIEVEPIEEPII